MSCTSLPLKMLFSKNRICPENSTLYAFFLPKNQYFAFSITATKQSNQRYFNAIVIIKHEIPEEKRKKTRDKSSKVSSLFNK